MDFIHACDACLKHSGEENGAVWMQEHEDGTLSEFPRYGYVEWSHLYYGALRFWANPWNCKPGDEYLCADPLSELKIDQFVTDCLGRSKSGSQNLFSIAQERLQLQDLAPSRSALTQCPTEILQLIVSYLPLRSAINLHACSYRLSSRIVTSESNFWRSYTVRLHGLWFWELWNYQCSPKDFFSYANWEHLLKVLSLSRRDILKEAQPDRLELIPGTNLKMPRRRERTEYTVAPLLPLGLRNRQRIWMCLESLDTSDEFRSLD